MKLKRSTIIIDLNKSEDQLWKLIHKNLRTDIRKAKKSGITARLAKNNQDVEICNELLQKHFRRKYTPILKSHKFLISNNAVLVAEYKGNIIGFVYLDLNKKKDAGVFKWAATNPKYNNLAPNSLLYWMSILFLKKRGYKYCDLGGSHYGSSDPQLLRLEKYKTKWNGQRVDKYAEINFFELIWIKYLRKYKFLKKIKYYFFAKFHPKYKR